VCLLIAMFGMVQDAPLIVAANRDERLDRPAVPITVLRGREPRILGGRDELAGGTWLAVNEHGVVAGLTNQPSPGGRDPAKRSRGELPLAFSAYRSAAEAVPAVLARLDPASYNPCWMLVGDTETLFFIGIPDSGPAEVEQLGPGLHVLENAPLRPQSAKAAFVTGLVGRRLADLTGAAAEEPGTEDRPQTELGATAVVGALDEVLADHQAAISEPRTGPAGQILPPQLSAACVHADGYGTRSAMTVSVPSAGLPSVRVADGRPCEHDLRDVSGLWLAHQEAQLAG
jgi:uncharacterized protein with NRDE domain